MGVCGKERELRVRDIFVTTNIILQIPMLGMCENEFRIWCLNFTTIQRLMSPRSSFFKDRFDGMQEKEKVLGGGEWKMKLRERG